MKGEELLDKMELVSPEFVEEAESYGSVKKRKPYRWIAVAACLVLAAGSVSVMAATDLGSKLAATEFGTKIIKLFTRGNDTYPHGDESGFLLSADIEKIPVDALKGRIRYVPDVIKEQYEQYENYQPFMSQFPGLWTSSFTSLKKAYNYIGYNGLTRISWKLKEGETKLYVHGDRDGNIMTVTVETPYTSGDMRLQFYTKIYTENIEEDVTESGFTTEYVEYTDSYYTTSNGISLQVIESTAMESGYIGTEGYLVKGGVLYHLHIAHLEKDKEQAKALLYEWAELF